MEDRRAGVKDALLVVVLVGFAAALAHAFLRHGWDRSEQRNMGVLRAGYDAVFAPDLSRTSEYSGSRGPCHSGPSAGRTRSLFGR